jgi:acyl carrier protein
MDRDEVRALVCKHISEACEGLSASGIDTARSMADYGLGSLDIVEVVSRSMRQLRVKVPRAELRKLTTINGLVDLLHRSAAAGMPPPQA